MVPCEKVHVPVDSIVVVVRCVSVNTTIEHLNCHAFGTTFGNLDGSALLFPKAMIAKRALMIIVLIFIVLPNVGAQALSEPH